MYKNVWFLSDFIFIRIIVLQAGIQKENLMIAYEPEVAALHCVSMPASQVTVRTRDNIALMFKPGCSFLVLDLGGNHIRTALYFCRYFNF